MWSNGSKGRALFQLEVSGPEHRVSLTLYARMASVSASYLRIAGSDQSGWPTSIHTRLWEKQSVNMDNIRIHIVCFYFR